MALPGELHELAGAARERKHYAETIRLTHNRMADRRAVAHATIGGLTILTTAIVSAGLLRTSDPGFDLRIAAGFLSLVGTVLAGAQTFYQFGNVAEKHRTAAAEYARARDQLELLLIQLSGDGPHDPAALRESLRAAMDKLCALDTKGPGISENLYHRYANQQPGGSPKSLLGRLWTRLTRGRQRVA